MRHCAFPITYDRRGWVVGFCMTFANNMGWQPAIKLVGAMALLGPLLAACASHPHPGRNIFSSKEFGVPVSKRVTSNPNPPHGGGMSMVGKPYQVHGLWYTPKANPVGYDVKGTASWYGWDFHGRLTANGEIFSANAITGGSPDLPLPCYARVTNLDNGRTLLVRFNDRGPYMSGRVVDLSERAATMLGYANTGTAHVRVQYVANAPLNGDDTNYLMASLNQTVPMGQSDIRVASVEPQRMRPAPMPATQTSAGLRPGRTTEMNQVLASVNGLFSYSEGQADTADINSAHAAVDAMAAQAPTHAGPADATVDEQEAIKLGLGTFSDPRKARDMAMQFAMLGAVDEDDVADGNGAPATRLTLTHLKRGVARQDVLDLVHKLGLGDVVLY
jgi:rare lipoprotein A